MLTKIHFGLKICRAAGLAVCSHLVPGKLSTGPRPSMREATLLYGIGAGIAAAAGTRLAFKLILTERCILLSF